MDDEMIVQLYWERNESAIAATSDKYGAYCGTIAMNILGNKSDSEECVNDTFMRAWETIPPQRPRLLQAFLARITRNLAYDRFKRDRTDKRGGNMTRLVLDELGEVIPDSSSSEEWKWVELADVLNAFLKAQPEDKRRIFVCRYFYADSIPEIAERFRITENNVSVSLNRMRGRLKKFLTERGFDV